MVGYFGLGNFGGRLEFGVRWRIFMHVDLFLEHVVHHIESHPVILAETTREV